MGCSLESYRVQIGTFNQKMSKARTMKSVPNVMKTVRLKTFARALSCWCLVIMLVSLNSIPREQSCPTEVVPPSLRQIINISPAKATMGKTIEQKHVSFLYPFSVASKVHNKEVHTQNGNHSSRGKPICICYWNKGSSYLINKREDIKEIINTHKPLVLGLGEAQFKKNHDLAEVQQPGYTLHLDSSQASLGVSRCAVYTHDSLVVKRRNDLEKEGISTVWLQLGLPHQKGILVMCGYRQWRLSDQLDGGAASCTVPAQRKRWGEILSQWERALSEGR